MTAETRTHKEAFALMWYGCERCGHRERIWNSRNGVTPFGTTCPSCGASMLHVDWQNDERQPNHKPHRGQRFWRDGTRDEGVAIIEKRLANFAKSGHAVPPAVAEAMGQEARDQTDDWRPGWPFLDRAP